MNSLSTIVAMSGTAESDWEPMDGPESGVGVEEWYVNEKAGLQAYVCDDQGNITAEIMEIDN